MATHNDPDLWNGVYGDLPYVSSRASALRRARPGDGILFFARLRPFVGERFDGKPGFYFVGGWLLDRVIDISENTRFRLGRGVMDNPHVRKRIAGSRQRFSLFLASVRGTRLVPPIRIDRSFLGKFLPGSRLWNWTSGRSPLKTLGSHLRTVKAINMGDHQSLTALCESEAR